MGERLSDECSLESVICGCRRSYDKIRALVRELSVRREEWLLTQIVQNTVYKCLRFVDESFPIPVHISGSWIHMSARGIRDFHAVWCRGLADVYQPRNYETKVWWEIKGDGLTSTRSFSPVPNTSTDDSYPLIPVRLRWSVQLVLLVYSMMARALSQSPWSARVGWRVRRPEARTRATCFLVPEEETLRSQRDMSYAGGELVSKWKKEVIARGNKKDVRYHECHNP